MAMKDVDAKGKNEDLVLLREEDSGFNSQASNVSTS